MMLTLRESEDIINISFFVTTGLLEHSILLLLLLDVIELHIECLNG
jgi:hypothetical protein